MSPPPPKQKKMANQHPVADLLQVFVFLIPPNLTYMKSL